MGGLPAHTVCRLPARGEVQGGGAAGRQPDSLKTIENVAEVRNHMNLSKISYEGPWEPSRTQPESIVTQLSRNTRSPMCFLHFSRELVECNVVDICQTMDL